MMRWVRTGNGPRAAEGWRRWRVQRRRGRRFGDNGYSMGSLRPMIDASMLAVFVILHKLQSTSPPPSPSPTSISLNLYTEKQLIALFFCRASD